MLTEQPEPQPVGTGSFGDIYDQFRGKPKEAAAFLMKKRSGEATGALSHRSVGEIDLVWGEEGTGKSDGFGLAKLVKYHPEVVEHLQELLDEMEVVSRSANRVNLESKTHKAGVRLDWDGVRKTWLMTMFEKKGASEPTNGTTDITGNQSGLENDTAPFQSPDVSDGKDNTNSDTATQNGENISHQSVELPRDKDGNIAHARLDPQDAETYAAAVNEEADNAAVFAEMGDADYVTRNMDAAQKAVDKAAKAKPKATGAAQLKAELADINAQRQAAKGLVDFWNAVQAELERRAAEANTEAVADETDRTVGTDGVPAETTEQPVEQTEQPAEEATQTETPSEEAPQQPEAVEAKEKPKASKPTKFQKRIDAIGEARSIEEAILLDIATGGARFRWGNSASDTKAAKRGIGDLWKYGQNEMRSKIGIIKADGFSIENYAEAIQQGQLIPYGISDGQVERMDTQDLIGIIEDVLQMVNSKADALKAIEERRAEEAEAEQRYIRSVQDAEAQAQGFEDWDDYCAYQESFSDVAVSDEEYYEISSKFAEQYQEEYERQQRAREIESETDTGVAESDEQQGVHGEGEGGDSLLQAEQTPDTGTNQQPGQTENSPTGNPSDGSSPRAATEGEPAGAAEVRAEIDRLKAQRANLIQQRDNIQRRYEQANGLFGDTQADEGDLFGGQNFLSPELAQATIDGYSRQIKQIDEQIARLEASLRNAQNVKQTELGEGGEDIPQHVAEALGELGVGEGQIHVVTDKSQLPKEEGTAYSYIKRGFLVEGWYNPDTGEVYLYAPNLKSKERVKKVVMHELVSHKGLRGLLGREGFDGLCDEVWKAMADADKRRMIAYVRYQDEEAKIPLAEYARAVADAGTRRAAADEYMAHLSEKGIEASVWERIRNAVVNALRKLGFDIGLSDADIRSLLRESYGALTADGHRQTPRNTTIDEAIRLSIRVNHNSPYLLKKADGSFVDPETGERLGFDHRFMNTGEGAQVHGWGSYFSVDDLRRYANNQSGNVVEYKGKTFDDDGSYSNEEMALFDLLGNNYVVNQDLSGKNEIISFIDEELKGDRSVMKGFVKVLEQARSAAERIGDDIKVHTKNRHHYSVEIPDNDGTNYIEERGPFGEEASALLRNELEKELLSRDEDSAYKGHEHELADEIRQSFPPDIEGGKAYGGVSSYLGGDKEASEFLHGMGYVGTHYDGRSDGECYVIFDENDAKIVDHVRFSVSGDAKEIARQMDERNKTEVSRFVDFLRRGKLKQGESRYFHIGETGSILNKYGINGKITVGSSAVNTHHTKDADHLNENEWVDVIDKINEPIAITRHGDSNNSYRIYTIVEKNGKNVCVGVDVNSVGRDVKITNIKTAFAREIANALNERLVYPEKRAELEKAIQELSLRHNREVYPKQPNSSAKVQQNSEPASENGENVLFSIRKPFGGNSGYVGYSKSKRAVGAEERGLRNKSQMDSAFADEVNALIQERNPNAPKVTLKQIKDSLDGIRADEWHHTSMYGNRTNYYSAQTIADHFIPETEEEKNSREQRETREKEYNALRNEIANEVYDSIPHEEINGKDYFRTSEGHLVEHTKNTLELSKRIRLIPDGANALVDDIDEWTHEHQDEYNKAIAEYNAAKQEAFDNVPQEKKDRVVELRNEIKDKPRFSIAPAQDRAYMQAVEGGDMETAQRMVVEAARKAGYTANDEYKDSHRAPAASVDKKDFTNLDALREVVENESADSNLFAIAQGVSTQPDDYFSRNGARWYGYDDAEGMESYRNLKQAINEINRQVEEYGEVRDMPTIKVYRSVPKEIKGKQLESGGQWVSPSRLYAKEHGLHRFGYGKYQIVEQDVRADELWWDGNDINEWGFDDDTRNAYQNTKNNRKLLDAVTYDDEGNVIPLSKRFNKRNDDIRFSVANAETEAIKRKALANGTFMKAPNGKPTKLTERQWLQVRTEAFKKWFGDWELAAKVVNIVSAAKEHGFKNFDEAKKWAKQNIVGTVEQSEIGEVNISGAAVDKYLSQKAVEKSVSIDIHLSALKIMPQIITNSIVGETHEDKKGDEHLKDIVLLYSAIDVDGKTYRVKTTVKRYNDPKTKTKAYSYEVTEIELLDVEHGNEVTHSPNSSNNSISGAKLLQNVKSATDSGKYLLDSSKIVDENGEPMVVYHGAYEGGFSAFDKSMRGTATNAKSARRGFFFTDSKEWAEEYARRSANGELYDVYLNMRNPLVYDFGGERVDADAELTKLINRAQRNGHDGVIALNLKDGFDVHNQYVAFSPNQIKSATDNNGEFDAGNPDIRFSISEGSEEEETPEQSVSEEELEGYDAGKMTMRDFLLNTLAQNAKKNKENVQNRLDAVMALRLFQRAKIQDF